VGTWEDLNNESDEEEATIDLIASTSSDAESEDEVFSGFTHEVLLEQNMFDNATLSFDDNKGIKKCQLNMLIFVQVCKTIDKNLRVSKSSIGYRRTNEEQWNLQKGSLCCKKAYEAIKVLKKRSSENHQKHSY